MNDAFYIALCCVLLRWSCTGGEERESLSQSSGWELLRGHDCQGWEFGKDTGVTPLLFMRSTMGFLMTTESQNLGLTSHPKDEYYHIIYS